jgi:tripartite-type tricarboxylate transporter receptor subunit TctC
VPDIAIAARLTASLAIAGVVYAAPALAQTPYPSKPVRFVVPYAAGGSVDPLVRLFTARLTESLGQPMIVDLRPGGNTIIGTEVVAKAAPDGHTVLVMTVPNHAINSILIPNLPYDSVRDFAPVTTVSTSDYVLIVHPSVPAGDLKTFIAFARARPGQLNYGSIGSLGISQLGTELFSQMTGIQLQRVPYKGSAPALIDLVSGQLQAGFYTPISAMQHVRNRRLRAIAASGAQRLAALPDVPTFVEAGLQGFEMRVTYAVMAPAGTPRANVEKLSAEFGKLVALPDIRERLALQGMIPFHSTPDQLAANLKADIAKYAAVIKSAKLKMD